MHMQFFFVLLDLPEIVRSLVCQPRFGTLAESHFESHRHFGTDRGSAIDDPRKRLARYSERLSSASDRKLERFEP
jgi:hypothetical protein